ncbi:MAG: glycosyltransferase family 4 protein [Candidatus Saccharibacteria bacterium]|nr:glycosyltransferase family 4 protein [Candidatus Saccharibacteria bacterium]
MTKLSTKSHSILFITRCFPPATGGMERFAKDLSDELAKSNTLSLLQWGGSKLALFFVLPYFFVRSAWMLATSSIDVIHAQDGVVSIMAFPLKIIFRKPMVVVIHGLDITFKNPLFQFLVKQSLGRADAILCISSAARDEVINRGINADKVHVIPLGVTDELFLHDTKKARMSVMESIPGVHSGTKILLSVGRLVERKGLAWFIQNVLPSVVKKEPNTLLLISGDGPMRESIEQVIDDTGLSGFVHLLGRTSDELLKNLYNAADCFIMPNISVSGDMEGFGRVLIEAALCEVPVVASGIEGIVDAIHDGKNGTLVPASSPKAHASAITLVLGDAKKAAQLGRSAREYSIKTFSWPVIAAQYNTYYDQLTEIKK